MLKNKPFPLRMTDYFKERIRKAKEKHDMNLAEYIRFAICERLDKDEKDQNKNAE